MTHSTGGDKNPQVLDGATEAFGLHLALQMPVLVWLFGESVARQRCHSLSHLLLHQQHLGGAAVAQSLLCKAAAALDILLPLQESSQLGLEHLHPGHSTHCYRTAAQLELIDMIISCRICTIQIFTKSLSELFRYLLLGAADVLQVSDEGVLALVQCSLQLLERAADLRYGLALPLRELPGDFVHYVDGCRQLRKPGGGRTR